MRYFFVLLCIVLGLTAYRAGVVLTNGLPLYVDEAQYWFWAQNLAWGYYSKPPMIAAVIAATTAVCGDAEPCVRAGSLIFYPLSTFILFFLTRRLFDEKTAFIAGLIFITLPAVGLSSLLISTDVLLFFFWTLALFAFVRVLNSAAWLDWILLGVALGLGLLTKYTMGIFFLSAAVYLLLSGRWQVFISLRAWVAVLIAAVIFSPNGWWNWQHDFPTVQHTAEISHLEQAGLHWRSLAEFFGGQFGVFGLVFFPVLLSLFLRFQRLQQLPQAGLLLSFSLPFLLIISLQALLGTANANWAAPSYVAATVLVAAGLVRWQQQRLLILGLMVNIALFMGLYHYQSLAHGLGVELTAKNDLYKRMRGWDEIGQQYLALQANYPQALPLAEERGVMSELTYYARPAGLNIVSWNPEHQLRHHYDLVTSLAGRVGQEFLFVSTGRLPAEMADYFEATEQVGELRAAIYADYQLVYPVYRLQNFKGLNPQ
ncbi:ArnT family glycosyltransferase [Thiothrix eikelboomii]|uniref:ArnT family glycosyltransferase n=1 Tax=Thiothrix eikelboomii TaxID=92487 RepID=UPI003BAF8B29